MPIMSPGWSPSGPRQKWLKPTSYRVAALAKLAMCPPRSPGLRLARTTMAIAFQRISEQICHSIAESPGIFGSRCGGMVLMYSVVGANGRWAPARRVSSTMFSSRWCARSGPPASMTALIDSSHSRVSAGSGSFSSTSFNQVIRSALRSRPRRRPPSLQGNTTVDSNSGRRPPPGGAAVRGARAGWFHHGFTTASDHGTVYRPGTHLRGCVPAISRPARTVYARSGRPRHLQVPFARIDRGDRADRDRAVHPDLHRLAREHARAGGAGAQLRG